MRLLKYKYFILLNTLLYTLIEPCHHFHTLGNPIFSSKSRTMHKGCCLNSDRICTSNFESSTLRTFGNADVVQSINSCVIISGVRLVFFSHLFPH